MKKIIETYNTNNVPVYHMIDEDFGDNQPGIFGMFLAFYPTIMISDLDMMNELYQTKNKIFDKHPLVRNCMKPLLGDTIIFAETTDDWSQRRKSLSTIFYKEKMIRMVDTIKNVIKHKLDFWQETYVKTGKDMNLVAEISQLH